MMISFKFKTRNCSTWLIIYLLTFTAVYLSITQLSKASLYGVLNVFTVNFDDTSSANLPRDSTSHVLLENISAKETELSQTILKIFFVQTSENDDILFRHGCSIESAARLHPHGLIFVLMRSQYIHLKKGSYVYLRLYSNIHFVHFNEQDIYLGTSLIRLNKIKRKQYIHYFSISHMSDFIRTALLFKYGGVYFDLDVIPLRAFDQLVNIVALESDDGVNVAVLAFEKRHLVLDLQMDIQLESMANQFHSLCWNCLGPLALTNALKHVCDQERLHIQQKEKCQEINILPSFVFYPIPYQQIPQFFRYSSENVNYLVKNSSVYSIHYFHHMTMNIPIEVMSPFAQIAELFCPKVYRELFNENLSNQSSTLIFTNTNLVLLSIILSLLCIFLLLSIGYFISYVRITRSFLLAMRHKFLKSSP